MEEKNLNELRGNPNNPRTISKKDFENLKQSIVKFGDLSGIVFNVRTGELVGGHQRVESFKALDGQSFVVIQEKYEQPTPKGTVAYGYVVLEGERYAYREVDWDQAFENAANIAANRITGQFDLDLLAQVTYQIQQADESLLGLTGQTDSEIKKLMQSIGVVDDEPAADDSAAEEESDELTFRLTREQKEMVQNAIEHVRITRDIPSQDNSAMNGNALYYIAQHYISTNPPLTPEQQQPVFVPPTLPQE